MMDDLRTRALLVGFDRAGAVGTVVPRSEIAEAAAGTEFPARLLLDLEKVEAPGEDAAQARVAVDWDQESLEQLLASTEDEEIELRFDERELALAFDDVDAHGLREKAAVLTIAVAAAGVSSSQAFARVAADNAGAAGSVAASGISATSRAGVPAVPVGGAERALAQDEKLTQGLDARTGGSASVNPQTGVPAVPVGGAERALVQDEKVSQGMSTGTGQVAATSSSSDSTLSTPELAGVVAGGVLLIAAAGFGVSRKRTPPALPA
jgi:hypothetical protein